MSSLTQKTEVSKFEFNHSEERAREGCIQIFKKTKKQKPRGYLQKHKPTSKRTQVMGVYVSQIWGIGHARTNRRSASSAVEIYMTPNKLYK